MTQDFGQGSDRDAHFRVPDSSRLYHQRQHRAVLPQQQQQQQPLQQQQVLPQQQEHQQVWQQPHLYYQTSQQQHSYGVSSANMAGGDPRDDPRPSTSTAMSRTDTSATHAPLTEQEFNVLSAQLEGDPGVGDSTINRLLDPGPGGSRAAADWSFDSAQLTHSDTLERNPGFVNPNELSANSEDVEMKQNVVLTGGGGKHIAVKMEQTQQQQIFYTTEGEASGDGGHTYVTVVENQGPWTNLQEVGEHLQQQQQQQQQVQFQILTPVDVATTAAVATTTAGPSGVVSSPTCANPTHDTWPGRHNFGVTFLQYGQSTKNKSWDYSADLNKLFIDMGKYVQVGFSAGESPPEGLLIRALPVYAEASYLKDPVKRCPNHASLSDASNKGFPKEFVEHLIRVNHDAVVYEEDRASERLSVLMPFEQPQVGVNYCTHLVKFMCLGSDVGGINRRPIRVIFTLETGEKEVVGRYTVDVRICSCPKRDRQQEETKHQVTQKRAQALAEGLARSNSVFTKPSAKKKKTDIEEFVMMPVAKADFEKLNEFAESAVCMRNPEKMKELKEQRRRLLEMHNRKYLNKPTAK